jgi:hypothetical protein
LVWTAELEVGKRLGLGLRLGLEKEMERGKGMLRTGVHPSAWKIHRWRMP